MKILLMGDLSSLHLNLRDGLRRLGYAANLASNGDGWKKLGYDISIKWSDVSVVNKVRNFISLPLNIRSLIGYDVIQFASPHLISTIRVNEFFIDLMKKYNRKSFLLSAGCSYYYFSLAKDALRYSPHGDCRKFDGRCGTDPCNWSRMLPINQRLAESVDGIIPIGYEYYIGYAGFPNVRKPIPIPINLETIEYRDNIVRNRKLVVFHGLNREGFKGTHHVRQAFDLLGKKYPNDLELIIAGKMPYDEYVKLIDRANIIVDQTNSYGWGVNALISLAKGKIVLGGAEKEALNYFGLTSSPIINILPSAQDIVEKVEQILHEKGRIKDIGHEGRKYIESHHDHIQVASQYLDEWAR